MVKLVHEHYTGCGLEGLVAQPVSGTLQVEVVHAGQLLEPIAV